MTKAIRYRNYPNENSPRTDCTGEMDIDYSIIEAKVTELNELGVDITLQEVGDIIESKFTGKKEDADLRRKPDGSLMYPRYTLLRYKNNNPTEQKIIE